MVKKLTKEKTRYRILMILKEEGPKEAIELAAALNITDMAVRQHLYMMEDEGDVCYHLEPRPKGRPAKLWQLTAQANAHFPDTHADFSTELISSIRQAFGEEGMEKLLDVRLKKQITDYKSEIPNSSVLDDKLQSLAKIRTREGYMAEILPGDRVDQFFLVENNCPVCEAAKECTGICARELDLFKILLGEDVKVERLEHIIEGARRCAYQISKNG